MRPPQRDDIAFNIGAFNGARPLQLVWLRGVEISPRFFHRRRGQALAEFR